MPEYLDNIVKYINSEGFAISSQSLNLEQEFNNLFREYGSAVGNTVVFAGRSILNAFFHLSAGLGIGDSDSCHGTNRTLVMERALVMERIGF